MAGPSAKNQFVAISFKHFKLLKVDQNLFQEDYFDMASYTTLKDQHYQNRSTVPMPIKATLKTNVYAFLCLNLRPQNIVFE